MIPGWYLSQTPSIFGAEMRDNTYAGKLTHTTGCSKETANYKCVQGG